ncbi:hypothetical protein E1A91_A08G274700v1 [Gossypium mustelinum]|uniref:Uncharacterized protein n=1 Tax=Gossypium mustelinum TaxID=34275 RepID=A0A5D2YF06_GOSMU|nr:hypothetical protein E1A91_A08G274700v1 [Gossypium mustelinum]
MLFHAVAEWPFPANVNLFSFEIQPNCLGISYLFLQVTSVRAALSSGTQNRKLDSITAKPL